MSETFGQALRRLRGERSLRDVAQLAACGKSYVSDMENGRRWPTRPWRPRWIRRSTPTAS
ncbi:helix-turn-helix domain-containing protein [Actinacidiphila sp. bgisy160]|uniref:helix-turn-helix domain-containing protein n=1 Tax=Actinacidiphila sp. bgisy160 TaxID=3413796 RepID=UPI003D75163D